MPLNSLLFRGILWMGCCFFWLPAALAAQTPEKLPLELIELLGELDERDQENLEEAILEAEQAKSRQPKEALWQTPAKGR